jgi:hypothetical protein
MITAASDLDIPAPRPCGGATPSVQRPQPGDLGDAAKAGARKFVESQTIPDISYADFAAGLGFESVEIHDPDEIRPLTWGLPGVGGGT